MANNRSDPIDELLVMDAQDGDRRAMEQLVARWQHRLWQRACRLTGNAETAWDVSQQVWVAIIRGLGRLDDPARFGPWVYRITTNKAIDHLKRGHRTQPLPAEPLEDDKAQPAETSDLDALLARLDPNKRAVIVLYYLEDLSVGEIARTLGVPPGTVKSRLHHGRAELKRRLQPESD